ncbi:MAG: transcription antitermination factor NusB [Holosporaceae bacterium]|jgi:N utilization substance protein B|nr:transcription antitermination factor NusB [Holosporaceae bacterium]
MDNPEPTKPQRKSQSSLRGLSRLCAVQEAYRAGFCQHKVSDFLNEINGSEEVFITESISIRELDRDFLRDLLLKMEENLARIDVIIEEHLSAKWSLHRLDPVIKYVLRLAITELLCFEKIPVRVVLNEYIEITKAFSKAQEVAFVNGLLNEAAQKIRP